MLLVVIFAPLFAAALIAAGCPPRRTAWCAAFISFLCSLLIYAGIGRGDLFHEVTSIELNPDWGLHLAFGVDGLSLIMVLLTTIVTLCAIWFAGDVAQGRKGYYACLLLISGGALGAFTSLDLFFFYAFHELALIPTFLLV